MLREPVAAPVSRIETTCRVVDDPVELEMMRPAWLALMSRSETNELMLGPDWLLTWWDVFGPHQGRELCAIAFHEGKRLVGFAPLLQRRSWYRDLLPLRRLELMGVPAAEIARLERERKASSNLTLTSPVSGTVLERTVSDGQNVSPDTPLFTIADLRRVWVLADLYEMDVARLKSGARAEFSVDGMPGRTFVQ